MQPIRILQMIDGLNVGGAEILLRDLAYELQEAGYHVSVCYRTHGPVAHDITTMGIPLTRLRRLARVDPTLLFQMCQVIRRERPQVVHTHLIKSDFFGRLAARLCGVPVVVSTLHNCDAWAANPLLARTYMLSTLFADELIAVSDEVRTFAIEQMGISATKIHTIPNGVSMARFEQQSTAGQAVRRELGIADDAPTVGIIARLMPQKDHATFLAAAAQIHQAMPQARFLVVGDGRLRETLIAQATDLGLNQAVIFCGLRSDIPDVLDTLDLLVFSSRWEGLPVALLEGMAAARPVVATAVGGVPGVVIDGHTGLLVPPGDPGSLAQACIRLLHNPDERIRMGQAGRLRVETEYSMHAMLQQTIEVYENAIKRKTQNAKRKTHTAIE